MEREIRNEQNFHQKLIFKGLDRGQKSPSDIDGVIELNNSAYLIIEVKHERGDFKIGQRIMYERLCEDLTRAGKDAYVVLAEHSTPGERDVLAENCTIRGVYFKYDGDIDWHVPNGEVSLQAFTEWFYDRYEKNDCHSWLKGGHHDNRKKGR